MIFNCNLFKPLSHFFMSSSLSHVLCCQEALEETFWGRGGGSRFKFVCIYGVYNQLNYCWLFLCDGVFRY